MLIACNEPATHRRVIVKYLRDEISRAIDRRGTMLASHPAMRTILEVFKNQNEVPTSLLVEKGVVSPSPNKVLRIVLRDDCGFMLVPADAAMALVLRLWLATPPPIDALQKLFTNDGGDGTASL
jgi:hypothetical protein